MTGLAAVAPPTVGRAATPTAKDNLATVRGFMVDVQAGFNAEAARQYVSPDYHATGEWIDPNG